MAFWNRKKTDEATAASAFGAIAVAKGFITLEQLQEGLECLNGVRRLGDHLVHLGFLNEFQKEEVLIEQQHLRGGPKKGLVAQELDRQHRLAKSLRSSLTDLTTQTHKLTAALKK